MFTYKVRTVHLGLDDWLGQMIGLLHAKSLFI